MSGNEATPKQNSIFFPEHSSHAEPTSVHARVVPSQGSSVTGASLQHLLGALYHARRDDALARTEGRARLALRLKASRKRAMRVGQRAATREALALVQRWLMLLERRSGEHLLGIESKALELAKSLATKVVERLAPTDEASLLRRIRWGIRSLSSAQPYQVYLSPESLAAINDATLALQADPSVPPGDVRIVTPAGSVILRWQSELQTHTSYTSEGR